MIKVEEMLEKNEFTIGMWLITSKDFHPFWNQWAVVCSTLAGECRGELAKKMDDSVTHEIVVMAIDPEFPVTFDWVEGGGGLHFLMPPDQVIQVTAENDAAARKLIEIPITMLENGQLSPDSDYRKAWEIALGGKTFYKAGVRCD